MRRESWRAKEREINREMRSNLLLFSGEKNREIERRGMSETDRDRERERERERGRKWKEREEGMEETGAAMAVSDLRFPTGWRGATRNGTPGRSWKRGRHSE